MSAPRPIYASLLLGITVSLVVQAAEIFVDDSCGNDAWSGLSSVCAAPDGPKQTLHGALQVAGEGDTITVAPSTYTGLLNTNLNTLGRSLTIRSSGGAATCTIDCQQAGRAFVVVPSATGVTIEGFTITNGYVGNTDMGGGAIVCPSSDAVIRDCVFTQCQSASNPSLMPRGGGAIALSDGDVRVYGCSFIGNQAGQEGGAIGALDNPVTVEDCYFEGNVGGGGGAIGGIVDVKNSTFIDNWGVFGGAIGGGGHQIDNCTFLNNINTGTAFALSGYGGAIFDLGSMQLKHSVLIGNEALGGLGGAVWSSGDCQIFNCLITENQSGGFIGDPNYPILGGAIELGTHFGGGAASVQSCTIVNNSAGLQSFALPQLDVSDCIIRDNGYYDLSHQDPNYYAVTPVNLSYTDISDGWWTGPGVFDADPEFVPGPNGDYYLSQLAAGDLTDSPCVDAGSDLADLLGLSEYTTRSDEVGDQDFVDLGYHYPGIAVGNPVAVADAFPNPAACNQLVTLDASSSYHEQPGLSIVLYEWDLDDDGQYDDATGVQVMHAFDTFGNHTVGLQVTDDSAEEKTATDSVVVDVSLGNLPPSADADGPYVIEVGQDLSLDASGSAEPDTACGDSIELYEWDIDNDGVWDYSGTSPTRVVPWADIVAAGLSYASPHTIQLRVTDSFDAPDIDTTTLTIYENEPVAVLNANPNPAACGQSVMFDASASYHKHPAHSIVSYEWDLDDDGQYDDANSVQVMQAFSTFGNHTVKLRVTDDNVPAKTDTDQVIIDVSLGNLPPEADAGGPYEIVDGQDLALDASGSADPDTACGDDIVRYEWDIDDDGIWDYSGTSPTRVIPWAELDTFGLSQTATNPVHLRVTDSLDATDIDSTILLIGSDCNGNGVPDAGDIQTGTSLDLNENEMPDECEPCEETPGDGDADLDGAVDIDDYSALEPCMLGPDYLVDVPCDYFDLSGDCAVHMGDVTAFQVAFGASGAWPDDPIAYWPLNENGGPFAGDASGYGNDGTITGASWVPGYDGSALAFSGSDEVYDIPPSMDDPITDALSVAAWVRYDGSTLQAYVLDARRHSVRGGFILYLSGDGRIVFHIVKSDGNADAITGQLSVPFGEWAHICATYDDNVDELRTYLNGQPDHSVTTLAPYLETGDSISIGNNRFSGSDRPFNGDIDELRVYNRALTESEVLNLYQSAP